MNDHLGTPREMFTEDGKVVWAASYSTWGKIRGLKGPRPPDNDNFGLQQKEYDRDEHGTLTLRHSGNLALQSVPETDHEFEQVALQCPLRFQGQYEDPESGLYYNRFRYYDPIATQYISPDPMKLGGGSRPYGYVNKPTQWIDPLGLSCIDLAKMRGELGLPVAGSDFDVSTLAKLVIGSKEFYGINAHGQPIDLIVNPISRTHAEADVFQQAKNAAIDAESASLYVDRKLCGACGLRGAVKSMANQLGIKSLTTVICY